MYCENCGNELNINKLCLCDNCGYKNTKHYDTNEIKKAVKYINIFLIVISSIILILLCLSIYGNIKSDKMSDSFRECRDAAEYVSADLYHGFGRLAVESTVTSIHYEKCIIFFGISFILLIIFGLIANIIYRKKIAVKEKYKKIKGENFD